VDEAVTAIFDEAVMVEAVLPVAVTENARAEDCTV
jgi:hypothetical protein